MTYTDTHTFVQNMFKALGVPDAEVQVLEEAGRTRVAVKTSQGVDLVGHEGERITAINHIVKRISEQQGYPAFSIDINDYYKSRTDALEAKARMTAERVRNYKTDIEMDPMNSYERMVVHSALSEEPGVVTESTGMGRDRRIIVRYKGEE